MPLIRYQDRETGVVLGTIARGTIRPMAYDDKHKAEKIAKKYGAKVVLAPHSSTFYHIQFSDKWAICDSDIFNKNEN